MGERRRLQESTAIYLVTNVTTEGQALMRPDEAVNDIIRNNLAWAADRRAVDLFAYNFNPDSFAMVVSAPRLNLGRFMGDFQGLAARQINAHHGRTGRLFAGRYQATRLLDDGAVFQALARVLYGPRRFGFVESPDDWRGVSSWSLHRTGEPLVGKREDRTRYREIRRANPEISHEEARELATSTHTIELAKLRSWQDKPHMVYHRAICALVESRALELDRLRTRPIAGMPTVASWSPTRRLGRHWRRAPICAADSTRRMRAFRKRYIELNDKYASAASALRLGRGCPRFPTGMIPPHHSRAVGAPPPYRAQDDARDSGGATRTWAA